MLYSGRCSCGKESFKVDLPQPLNHYQPRVCDCDFCQLHKLSYLSDPDGILFLNSALFINKTYQGSRQAAFLSCHECAQVIAVVYRSVDDYKGAINASLLDKRELLGVPQTVSPKLLSAEEKVERWQKLWLSVVKVDASH